MATFRKGNIRLARDSIAANRVRSLLTTLGIVIGVLSVISIVSISEGVKQQIGQQTIRYGRNVLMIRPDSTQGNVLTGDALPGGANTGLSGKDVDSIRHASGVAAVVSLSTIGGAVKGDHTVKNPLVIATNTDFTRVISQKIDYGSFFDSNITTPSVVLGAGAAQRLFDDSVPLGQTLVYRGQQFVVSGIFSRFTAPPFSMESNFNDAIFIPDTTAQNLLGSPLGVYEILVKTKPTANTKQVSDDLSTSLLSNHGGSQDFVVLGTGAGSSASNQSLRLLTVMTAGVALIAFLVGGIGIMNVMLVSVTERVHEIGLRKALGATNRQIVSQFVTEALVLSTVGALIGLAMSVLLIFMLRFYTSLQPSFYWPVMVFTPLVAVLTGVLFGSFPAYQASQKDPIEALRHE